MSDELFPRRSVFIFATIAMPAGTTQRVRVRDLSEIGARIDHDGTLATGDRVTVTIGNARTVRADVVHADADTAGLSFARAIDFAAARGAGGGGPRQIGWAPRAGVARLG